MIGAMLDFTLENGLGSVLCSVAVKGTVLALALIAAYASKKKINQEVTTYVKLIIIFR